ncbi:MAG: FkbM family methyltransferase [Phycisphaerales bacterium JB058]
MATTDRQDRIAEQDILTMDTRHGPIRFLADTGILKWRAETLLTKEPDTIDWIDTFEAGEVFWDIGANVGVYSLYAARAGKVSRTLAFEPSPWNFAALVRSTHLNNWGDRIWPYCLAISDETKLDTLHMKNAYFGSAQCSFGERVNQWGGELDVAFEQASIGFSVDAFIVTFNPPFPNRIKIDVDGLDGAIARGMTRTVRDERVRSVLIEIDRARTGELEEVTRIMAEGGLELRNPPPAGGWIESNNFCFTRPGF